MRIGNKTSVTRELTRQEKNRRNNIKRLTISAIFALILFVALTIIQSSILNQEEKDKVYQVVKDIEVGMKITEENIDSYLQLKEVQLSLIPSNYITESSDLIGKFVNREYKTNDIITADGLTDTEKIYMSLIENPVEISFMAEDLGAAVGGIVREGDYINIYGLRKADEDEESFADTDLYAVDTIFTFKHVYVCKVFDSAGSQIEVGNADGSTNNAASTLFSIIISEADAEQFNEMIKNCDIKVAKLLYNTDQDYTEFIHRTNKSAAKAEVVAEDKKEVYEEVVVDLDTVIEEDMTQDTETEDTETEDTETEDTETEDTETQDTETTDTETIDENNNTTTE